MKKKAVTKKKKVTLVDLVDRMETMSEQVGGLAGQLGGLVGQLGGLAGQIADLAAHMETRFHEFAIIVNNGFQRVEDRLSTVETEVADLKDSMRGLDERVQGLEETTYETQLTLNRVEVAVSSHSRRIKNLEDGTMNVRTIAPNGATT